MEAIRLDEDAALKAAGALQGACEFESHRFRLLEQRQLRPVAQRLELLPYKQTIGGSSPPGTTRAGVAQRKEASVLGTEQCRFESCRR